MVKKITVAVLFGGRSVEHEIALRSAASIMQGLDPEKYSIVPIGIDKSGKWLLQKENLVSIGQNQPEVILQGCLEGAKFKAAGRKPTHAYITVRRGGFRPRTPKLALIDSLPVDVIF